MSPGSRHHLSVCPAPPGLYFRGLNDLGGSTLARNLAAGELP